MKAKKRVAITRSSSEMGLVDVAVLAKQVYASSVKLGILILFQVGQNEQMKVF